MKENKLIASVVVFKELHDNNKDIYDIIAEFLKAAIIDRKKWHFNSTEITLLLEEVFDFKLPEAVIKTTLKNRLIKSNFIKLDNGEYSVINIEEKLDNNFDLNYQSKKNIYQKTENDFIKYIEEKNLKNLSNLQKEKVQENLRHYLLGNAINEEYTQQISSYIIENKDNKEFRDRLNVVKEGVVLYTGIRYTANLNQLGHWKNELTIFLDTAIIFNFAGYNGEIYKEIFNDFHKLVKEINLNPKNKGKIIKLKFFEQTEKEIMDFFHVASLITEGKMSLNPSKTAMKEIINGCSSKSDILVKRNKLFIDLQTSGISIEEDKNYYENHNYNIEGDELINILKEKSIENKKHFNEEDCKNYLKQFTKINVLRKGENSNGFEKSKFIILTGNGYIHYLAHNNLIKKTEKDIPFATDIDYITNKFWFKLKKGFGKSEDLPKSFDIITKAQIILSAQLNNTVQEKFTALNEKFKSGEISKDEAISLNYTLRENILKPEEISEISIEKNLVFINEFTIEEHIREKEFFKQKIKDGERASAELKRRDSKARADKIRTIKRNFRIIKYSMSIFTVIAILIVYYLGYLLILELKESGDSKLSIIGFIIGIIFLIPVGKYWKSINKFYSEILLKKYRNKITNIKASA
jgi:hypothetical protein